MGLEGIVFQENPQKEIEVMGKKIVVRGLTTEDSIGLDVDYANVDSTDMKVILKNTVEVLATSIVSIDGKTPDSKEETKAFLLKQPQAVVLEIFRKSDVYGIDMNEEVKNSEGTPA